MLLVELQEGAVLTMGSGSPERLSLGLWVSHRSRGHTAVLGLAGLGRNLFSWAFPGSCHPRAPSQLLLAHRGG